MHYNFNLLNLNFDLIENPSKEKVLVVVGRKKEWERLHWRHLRLHSHHPHSHHTRRCRRRFHHLRRRRRRRFHRCRVFVSVGWGVGLTRVSSVRIGMQGRSDTHR